MKAQRRHVLKQNTLAHGIENLPRFARTQGPRILLAAAAIALIVLLVFYRMNTTAKRLEESQGQLARVQEKLAHLKFLSSARAMQEVDPAEIAHLRDSDYDEANQEIEQILMSLGESDAQLAAQTYVAKGDLNWMMANLPPLPGAATQPFLQPAQSQAVLLKTAEDAYNMVVEKYPGNELSLTAARFGLAAIAENRQDWEKARNEYQAAIDDKKTPPSLVVQAQTLIQQDEQLVNPFMIGMATTMPTTIPSTMPTTQGMDMNALEPTTAPAATQP